MNETCEWCGGALDGFVKYCSGICFARARTFEMPRAMSRKLKRRNLPVVDAKAGPLVYVVQSGDYVKVGHSTNFSTRFYGMSSDNPHQITVCKLFYVDSLKMARSLERRSHEKLMKYHHRGEWFSCPPEYAIEVVASVQRDGFGETLSPLDEWGKDKNGRFWLADLPELKIR